MPRRVCKPGHVGLLRRALYDTRQASWLWQKAVGRAVKELEFVHLAVVLCPNFRETWEMSLTYMVATSCQRVSLSA